MIEDLSAGLLGKKTVYSDQYDPSILQPVNRNSKRLIQGVDIWNCYDFTWLNHKNLPEYGMMTIFIPSASPKSIEAKSLKLYLYSFANTTFQSINDIVNAIEKDLENITAAKIKVSLANILVDFMHLDMRFTGTNLDALNINVTETTVNPELLASDSAQNVTEQLCSDLLKINSLTSKQPDWGAIRVSYTGPKITQEGLLKYLVSYRNLKCLPEQCIERIFADILQRCSPSNIVIEGRFTRRGGLDVNPIRANTKFIPQNHRLFRQ